MVLSGKVTPGGGLVVFGADVDGVVHGAPFPTSRAVMASAITGDGRVVYPFMRAVCGRLDALEGVEAFTARHGGGAVLPVCITCRTIIADDDRWALRLPPSLVVSADVEAPVTIDMSTGRMTHTATGDVAYLDVDDDDGGA